MEQLEVDKIDVSLAQLEDTRGILEAQYEAWLSTYPDEEVGITREDIEDRFKGHFTVEGIQAREQRIINAPENHFYLVAKKEGHVVGMCNGIVYSDKNQLQAIYIHPRFQGQGVGKLLWKELVTHFNPKNNSLVEVASYNKSAIEFYRRLGFQETGKRFQNENFRMKSGSIIPEIEMMRKADL